MFSLSICLGSATWRLLYKTEEKANEHYAMARAPLKTHEFNPEEHFQLIDDFGQQACFRRSAIVGTMLENLDKSRIGNVEFGMHNAKTQLALQTRMQADPSMRRTAQPGIVTPMGNGMFNA